MSAMEFIEAAKSGDLQRMRQLHQQPRDGCPVNVNYRCPPDGSSALYWAACSGNLMACDWLIRHGASVSLATDKSGSIPLHGAADRGHTDCVRLLILSGRELINTRTASNGDTPLHLAAYRGHLDICRLLLAHGACLEISNIQGRTVLDEARITNNYDIFQLLCSNRRSKEENIIRAPPGIPFACQIRGESNTGRGVTEGGGRVRQKLITLHRSSVHAVTNGSLSSHTCDDGHPSRVPLTVINTFSSTDELDRTSCSSSKRLTHDVIRKSLSDVTAKHSTTHHTHNRRLLDVPQIGSFAEPTRLQTRPSHVTGNDVIKAETVCVPNEPLCIRYNDVITSKAIGVPNEPLHATDNDVRLNETVIRLYRKLSQLEEHVERLHRERTVKDDLVTSLERRNLALEKRLSAAECTERELAASRALMACYVKKLQKCERDLRIAQGQSGCSSHGHGGDPSQGHGGGEGQGSSLPGRLSELRDCEVTGDSKTFVGDDISMSFMCITTGHLNEL